MKILFKLAVTRMAHFSLKCTQNRLSAGFRQDPLGELTALPRADFIAGFKGAYLRKESGGVGKGRDGRGGDGGGMEKWGGERTEGEGMGWKGKRSGLLPPPRPTQFSGYATGVQFYFWRAAE